MYREHIVEDAPNMFSLDGMDLFCGPVEREWIEEGLGRAPETVLEFGSYDGGDGARYKSWWPKASVVSIEADPYRYSLILAHVAHKAGISVHHAAVCERTGVIDWYPSFNNNLGTIGLSGSIRKRSPEYQKAHDDIISFETATVVPAVRLDDLVRALGIDRVDYIHMDVEGAEADALCGLGALRPKMILMERCVDPEAYAGEPPASYVATMMGYHVYKSLTFDDLMIYGEPGA